MRAYHFTSDKLRDGRPIPTVGEWLEHMGDIEPCKSGLHASKHPFDALQYAPGPLLHMVELEGNLLAHGKPIDKWVGRRRKIISTINAEELLREFACWCAWQVIHLWDAPDVVREYLYTINEDLVEDAKSSATDAIYGAKLPAERAAARAAAHAAAYNIATNPTSVAAAVDAAAYAVSEDAADAVRTPEYTGAVDETRFVARTEFQDVQRRHFLEMVKETFAVENTHV
jgi:hypothetical protein